MEEFIIRKHIRSATDEGINDYIESLENYILESKNKHTNRLLMKLEEVNGVIADDIEKIINGTHIEEKTRYIKIHNKDTGEVKEQEEFYNVSTLRILVDEKDSKVMDRVLNLYGKINQIQSVSMAIQSLVPEVEDKKEQQISEDVKEYTIEGNIFEFAQSKTTSKKGK